MPDIRKNALPLQFGASLVLLTMFVALTFFSLLAVAGDAKQADRDAESSRSLVTAMTSASARVLNADPADQAAVQRAARAVTTSASAADRDPTLGLVTGNTIRSVATVYAADPVGEQTHLVQTLNTAVATQTAAAEARASDRSSSVTRAIALGIIGLIGVVVTLLLFGRGMLRTVFRPIRSLASKARRLGAGDLSTRVSETGVNDVKDLARSINSMAIALDAKRKTLDVQQSQVASTRAETNRANMAKTEFLSRMSHELRTPLNAILGFAQLLELDELDTRQRDNVAHIISGGRHLLDLINEVLEITRIEAGSMSPVIEPVHANELVRSAIELIGPLAAQRGIEVSAVETQTDLWVAADEQRLKQVLLNLLANAVKYNRDSGSVTVSLKRIAGRARIEVTDTGQGIPQDQLPRLFIPFERLGAESTDVEGTGLGLVLALRLMEAMDGTLGVESQPWIGSTFHIELPLAEAPALTAGDPLPSRLLVARPEAIMAEGGVRRVLYIEDDPANAHLMAQLFAEEPRLELMTTMYGKLGIELARQHKPDLVLLDVNLPDLGGDEVIKRLRADEGTRDIPVIAVSADATSESRAWMTALGAARYLTKPITLNVVMTAVWDVLDEPKVAA